MPYGKYFFIKSKLHGLVLTVQDGEKTPGTPIVPFEQKSAGTSGDQLWYMDSLTSTVRSRMHDFCLDLNDDNTMLVNPYKVGETNQQFELEGDRLCRRSDSLSVVEIMDADEDPGARVCVFEYSGDDHQRWEFEYMPAQFFYIISELSGMCIDIYQGKKDPGSVLKTWTLNKTHTDNQLWYEDKESKIRSKSTNFLMDSSKGKEIRVQPDEFGNPGQDWIIVKNRIVNKFNSAQCIATKKKSKKKKIDLVAAEYKGDKHQHWQLKFVETDATFAEKGSDEDDDDDDDDSDFSD